ncbi:hypothetical protein HY635_01325 [Candidatus Uhrbacteria bacterium]|nr:hypothetical protein [Candidatus Uhrbacteria bacterium]
MTKQQHHPEQFDLFKPRPTSGEEPPSAPPPEDGEPVPADVEESYEPTPEDEQARVEMEHGPQARYVPPKTRAQREAEKRAIKRMTDDALGRMGAGGGRQLLTDAESPFAQGSREEERRRGKKKE